MTLMQTAVLRVEVVEREPDDGNEGPQVRLLIDGEDFLSEIFEGVGIDPDDLIGPFSPLRADDVPRDAAVMCCSCGVTDCSLLVVNVRREGDDVVWDDFRMGPGMDPVGLAPIGAKTLRFGATQYMAELDRAHEQRDWETHWRAAGRLAREGLTASGRDLEAHGYTLRSAWQFTREQEHALGIELYERRDDSHRQVVLAFGTDTNQPERRAEEIIRTILDGPDEEWPVAYRGEWTAPSD